MTIVALDDEILQLNMLMKCIRTAAPGAELQGFNQPDELLAFARRNKFDVAFLDIQLFGANGMEVAKKLKLLQPHVNIIFCTAYSQYAAEAFSLRASGYILKPVTLDAVRTELDTLRNPTNTTRVEGKLEIQCFGNFEIFWSGQPLRFERSKSKELFAYLIDRKGAAVTILELCSVLWDSDADSSMQGYCRTLISDIGRTLKKIDQAEVLIKSRNAYQIERSKIICDYYNFLADIPDGIRAYNGEYMEQYKWAAVTKAGLQNSLK